MSVRWLVVVLSLLFAVEARADAIPDGVRELKYAMSVENLSAYPEWVFFVYPTTNYGYAYRFENEKPVASLFVEEGRHGSPGTSLYAVKKASYEKISKVVHAHGDNGEAVEIFALPPDAVKSNLLVTKPKGTVRIDAPEVSLTRVFRIEKITEQAIVLTLVKSETGYKERPPATEKKRGCSIGARHAYVD